MNTEIISVGFSADNYLHFVYSCNDAGELPATSYGADRECSASNAGATTVYSTSTTAGALHSFDCSGGIDFVSYNNFRDDDTCCDDSVGVIQTARAATDVCIDMGTGNYTKLTLYIYDVPFAIAREYSDKIG